VKKRGRFFVYETDFDHVKAIIKDVIKKKNLTNFDKVNTLLLFQRFINYAQSEEINDIFNTTIEEIKNENK
jgi:hypothetical protein